MKLDIEIRKEIKHLTSSLYDGYELQLEKLCEKLCLKCYLADFDDDKISGSILRDDNNETYSIYVNRKHPPNRRRFTIAHEIGHYISFLKGSYSKEVLEKNGALEDYAIMFREEGKCSEAETEANLIAAEILMPEEKVRELVEQDLTIEEMADKFFVSPASMAIRVQTFFKKFISV